MCGIVGIYGEGDKSHLPDMMQSVIHRGPDGFGKFADTLCALGHERLSIIDLSEGGHQPMCNEDENVWSVGNGEIYNWKTLREELRAKGHAFRSECDSEVIAHAYEEWGSQFVRRLRGMFALAVYDRRSGKLLLARDTSGKKPLYYAWNDGQLFFGSEIKSLLAGGIEKAVNYTVIPEYLKYGYVPGTRTMFKGVRKLPAGCLMTMGRECQTVVERYWEITDRDRITDRVAPNRLRRLLEESVRLRLQSDVPIGAFLSGGVDSSAVVALWRKQCSGKIHTFTASFGLGNTSEARQAKQVSRHLDTEYHEVEITAGMVAGELDKVTWHHDEPLGDAATICNYFLAKEAKKYVSVVLAGEGGDELFGGYPWHRWAGTAAILSNAPPVVKEAGKWAIGMLGAGDPMSWWYELGRVALLGCQRDEEETLMYSTTSMSDSTLEWLLKPGFLNRGYESEYMAPAPESMTGKYNRALAMDYLNLLPEKFLMKADKGTMAWAVEERLPLLDQEVVKLAFQMSPRMKQDKWALRKSVEDLLPKEITWRPKQGFGTPVAGWMGSKELRGRVEDVLGEGGFLGSICQKKALESLRQGIGQGEGQKAALGSAGVIWGLFALGVWENVWFGKGKEQLCLH